MKIGVIGGGAIAQFLLKQNLPLESMLITDRQKYESLAEAHGIELFTDVNAFLASGINLVVEAANIEAVKLYLPVIVKKMDAIVISIGAFADDEFLKEIYDILEDSNYRIHLPSGAIAGLDLLGV